MMADFPITARITAIDNASRTFKNIGKNAGLLDKAFSGVLGTATGVFTGMIAFGGAQAISSGISDIISSTVEYEKNLKQIQIFGEMSSEQIQNLDESLKSLAREGGYGLGELQESMIDISKAGFVGEDALKIMEASMYAAMATGEQLAGVTDTTLGALRAFQYKISDVSKVSDILTIAANISSASISDMGTALGYVGGQAYTVGWSLEDMATAIAHLTNLNLDASQAGTYLRGVITDLISPSDKIRKQMDELGITIYDNQGKLIDFADVVDEFREALLPIKEEGKDIMGILGQIFDVRSATAMAMLIEQTPEQWREMRDAIDETGVSEAQAEEMTDTLAIQLKQLQANINEVKLELGQKFIPVLKNMVSAVVESGLVDDMGDLALNVLSFGLNLVGIDTSDVNSLADAIYKLAEGTEDLNEGLKKANEKLRTFRERVAETKTELWEKYGVVYMPGFGGAGPMPPYLEKFMYTEPTHPEVAPGVSAEEWYKTRGAGGYLTPGDTNITVYNTTNIDEVKTRADEEELQEILDRNNEDWVTRLTGRLGIARET